VGACLVFGVDLQQEALQFPYKKKKKKSLTHFLCPHVLTRVYFKNEVVMKKEKIGWVKLNFKW